MAKDKKGKGSGSKDACYHKVKSRYSVWPSAYASGALVKCRKVGAANWGNSTKKESFEIQDGVVEGAMPEPIDPKKHKDAQKKQKMRNLAINNENPNEKKVAEKKAGGPKLMGEGKHSKSETYVKGTAPVRATYGGKTESFPKETYKKKSKKVEVDEKYQGIYQEPTPTLKRERSSDEKARMSPQRRIIAKSKELEKSEPGSKRQKKQKKASMQFSRHHASARESLVKESDKYDNVGKQAARMSLLNNPGPRSTPEQSAAQKKRLEKKHGMKLDDHPQFKKEEVDKRRAPAELVARLSAKREGHMAQDGPNKAAYDAKQRILKKTKEKMAEQMLSEKPYQITGPHSYTAGDGDPKDDVKIEKTPYNVGKPMKSKVRARNKVDKMNQEYGASVYRMKYVEGIEDSVQKMLDEAGKKCWKGYKKAGTQKLFGKTYNRCVKANEELSIDQQMKISRDYNRMSPEEKKKANQKAVAGIPKGKPKKDTRTDAQKMVDAAYGKRPTNPKGSLGT